MRAALFFGVTSFLIASTAVAKSEKDRDTDDRRERAERSSSNDDSNDHDHHHHHHHRDHDPCCGVIVAEDPGPWVPEQPPQPVSGDLALAPQLALDHPGGGFMLDMTFPYLEVGESRRTGLAWRFDLNFTRWLDDYRPEGATYTSTLDLLRINTTLAYKVTWLTGPADISLSIGPGFTYMRAIETFDDGLSLDETLLAGLTLGPSLHVDFNGGLFGGRAFVDAGVAVSASWASPYLAQYDSLLPALSIFMITPRASIGHYWELQKGVELGGAYEIQTIGGLQPEPMFSHVLFFTVRFSSYTKDREP